LWQFQLKFEHDEWRSDGWFRHMRVRIFLGRLGRRADAGEAWGGISSPCHSVAQEPVEPLIAAMRAKARRISGKLLPAARIAPSTKELVGRS
jgi:hypothetical protein